MSGADKNIESKPYIDNEPKPTVNTDGKINNGQSFELGSLSSIQRSQHRINPFENPYFLHHADSPGTQLISYTLIGPENYGHRRRSMEIALCAQNNTRFVDGSLTVGNTIDPQFQSSRCTNNLVLTCLLNSCSQELWNSYMYATTAREVLSDFEERFNQDIVTREFELHQLVSHCRQDNMSIGTYFTVLKGYWDGLYSYLGNVNVLKTEELKMMQLLAGLNESYLPIRGQIVLIRPVPTDKTVVRMLQNKESRRLLSNNAPAVSFAAFTKASDHTTSTKRTTTSKN